MTAEDFFVAVYVTCGLSVFVAFMTNRPYTADCALLAVAVIFVFAGVIAFGFEILPRLT